MHQQWCLNRAASTEIFFRMLLETCPIRTIPRRIESQTVSLKLLRCPLHPVEVLPRHTVAMGRAWLSRIPAQTAGQFSLRPAVAVKQRMLQFHQRHPTAGQSWRIHRPSPAEFDQGTVLIGVFLVSSQLQPPLQAMQSTDQPWIHCSFCSDGFKRVSHAFGRIQRQLSISSIQRQQAESELTVVDQLRLLLSFADVAFFHLGLVVVNCSQGTGRRSIGLALAIFDFCAD